MREGDTEKGDSQRDNEFQEVLSREGKEKIGKRMDGIRIAMLSMLDKRGWISAGNFIPAR